MKKSRYTFGPVPSRRLGRSLGIDLVPHKTCSYDCLYCQLGCTTHKTVERREWVPMEDVVTEIKEKLGTRPDYITLSGSGEPTLYNRIAGLIDRIRGITDIPVAVLTNGSLLWRKDVREDIAGADVVIPSLDAGSAFMFSVVNRPHESIGFDQMLDGLIKFKQEYHGAYWLEILLLGGYTALAAEVDRLAACVGKIRPDKVQLNTVTRPPAEDYAASVSPQRMHVLAKQFDPPAEVIADFRHEDSDAARCSAPEDIMTLLRRRPCTAADVSAGLQIHMHEAVKILEQLAAQKKTEPYRINNKTFFRTVHA